MSEGTENQRLTERQRRQVEENMGLVAVHLRRHVKGTAEATRDREGEDLFQEGCLGLIQAVQTFRSQSGIPLPAYLLPRIHTAVSRALRGGFTTVRRPVYRPRRTGAEEDTEYPTTVALDFDPQDRRPDPRHTLEGKPEEEGTETIGERIRARYVRSVRRAAEESKRARPARSDRAQLVDCLVEQRLLVPEAEARASLHSLARQTRSSYARVAQCEKRILDRVRAELTDDAETQRLREEARRNAEGMETPIDARLEAELEQARIDAFVARLRGASPERRGTVLLALIDAAGICLEALARTLFACMPPQRHVEFLETPV